MNERYKNYPVWFLDWQQKFYKSNVWIMMRDLVRDEEKMICRKCNHFIYSKPIVDHIIEVTPENYLNWKITLNRDNLQLLCISCHNKKTFEKSNKFSLENRDDINLF